MEAMEEKAGEKHASSGSGSGSDTNSIRQSPILRADPEKDVIHLPTAAAIASLPESVQEQQEPPSPWDVPEGGLEAWLQVLGSWVLLVDTWGLINSFGVFQTYYERQLLATSSPSDISWIGSLQASLLMLVGPISGPLYDAGYFREVLWAGLFLIIFGQFMTSLCKEYWQVLLAQGVCIGLGCGLVFLPSAAILAQYFRKRRSLVIGISSTGSPIAGAVFPIIFGRLVPKIGFGWATRIIAFILLGISVIPIIFMHTRLPPSRRMRSLVDKTALKDAAFMLITLGSFFAFLTLYVAFFYIQLFAVEHNLCSVAFSPYLVTFLSVGSIFGRLGPNYLADKIGPLNIWAIVAIISAILVFVWMGITTFGGIVAFALLFGLFSGGLVSVAPSVVVSLTPDMSLVGTRMGMLFAASGISVLVGTPIAGAILTGPDGSRWAPTIAYAAAALMLGGLGFTAGRVVLFIRKRDLRA